jgi:hypothetical protein
MGGKFYRFVVWVFMGMGIEWSDWFLFGDLY